MRQDLMSYNYLHMTKKKFIMTYSINNFRTQISLNDELANGIVSVILTFHILRNPEDYKNSIYK